MSSSSPQDALIYTAGGELYAEDIRDWKRHVVMTGFQTYPAEAEGEIVAFKTSIADEELDGLMKEAVKVRKQMHEESPRKARVAPMLKGVTWYGDEYEVPGSVAGQGSTGGRHVTFDMSTPKKGNEAEADLAPPDGHVWVVCDVVSPTGYRFGQPVQLGPGSFRKDGAALMISAQGAPCVVSRRPGRAGCSSDPGVAVRHQSEQR